MDSLNEKELMDILSSSQENMEIAMKISGIVANPDKIKEMYFDSLENDIKKLKKQYQNLDYINFPESEKYDDRAIFVVKTDKIHAYIGWNKDKHELFCQAEYDSYQTQKDKRRKRDETFDNLGLNSLLNEENEWCRWEYFKYDWNNAFKCLEEVITISQKTIEKDENANLNKA